MKEKSSKIKKSRKTQIEECAALMFKEKGYKASSMRDLAEGVGLSVSSLYSHFSSKEELLQLICMQNALAFTEGMQLVFESKKSVIQKLEALLCLHIDMAIESPSSVIVFGEQWKNLSEPHLSEFLLLRKSYEDKFLKIIQQGIERGELQTIDAQLILLTLLNGVRWLNFSNKKLIHYSPKQLKTSIVSLLLQGVIFQKND